MIWKGAFAMFGLFNRKYKAIVANLDYAYDYAIAFNSLSYTADVLEDLHDPSFAGLPREEQSARAYVIRTKYINGIVATTQELLFSDNPEAQARFSFAMVSPRIAGVPDEAEPSVQLFYCLFHYALTGKPYRWSDARKWEDKWAEYVRKPFK